MINFLMLTFLILACTRKSNCKLILTDTPLSISEYSEACTSKGMLTANLSNTSILKAARLLHNASLDRAWIHTFKGKSYNGFELTVKMVSEDEFMKWYVKYPFLGYGPDPRVFKEFQGYFLPVIAPLPKSSAIKNGGIEYRGICMLREDEDCVKDSEATVIIRRSEDIEQGQRVRTSRKGNDFPPVSPSASIIPVFNPPPKAPASAFIDQRSGRLPNSGTQVYVPSLSVNSGNRKDAQISGNAYLNIIGSKSTRSQRQKEYKPYRSQRSTRKGTSHSFIRKNTKKSKSKRNKSSSSSIDGSESEQVIYNGGDSDQ